MADFDFVTELLFELAADFGDNAETADAGGLVDENDLIFVH